MESLIIICITVVWIYIFRDNYFKHTKTYQLSRDVKKKKETVLDLSFNNQLDYHEKYLILPILVNAIVGALILLTIYPLAITLFKIEPNRIKWIIFLSFTATISILILFKTKLVPRILKARKRFSKKDITINDKELIISPFLINDKSLNPDLNTNDFSERKLDRLHYLHFPLSDIESLTVSFDIPEFPEVKDERQFYEYEILTKEGKKFSLLRIYFLNEEEKFL